MLKTQKAYKDAVEAIRILETDEIPREEARWRAKGASDATLRRIVGSMRAQVARLRAEVDAYDRIKSGDLSMFVDVEDLGQLLIAARLARGMTQRELAEKLAVHESQISRDERYEYDGITVERLHHVCEALDLDLTTYPRLRASSDSPSGVSFEESAVEAAASDAPRAATDWPDAEARADEVVPASPAPAPASNRASGWAETRIPASPYAAPAGHPAVPRPRPASSYASPRWQAAPAVRQAGTQTMRGALAGAASSQGGEVNIVGMGALGASIDDVVIAGLPRIPVTIALSDAFSVGGQGPTTGATGPFGPFVYMSWSALAA